MKHFNLKLASILLPSLLAVTLANAAETTCIGTLPAGTYDSVVVPAGASCTLLTGVMVKGNVIVNQGASLNTAPNNITIGKNLIGTSPNNIIIAAPGTPTDGITINGNISIDNVTNLTICGVIVNKNVTITNAVNAGGIAFGSAGCPGEGGREI